jgi:hypothetical protein
VRLLLLQLGVGRGHRLQPRLARVRLRLRRRLRPRARREPRRRA